MTDGIITSARPSAAGGIVAGTSGSPSPADIPHTSSAADSEAVSIVSVDHFRMDFGHTTVIRDLSFEIQRGETFGFLGSNGSGKTTTIRALLGIYTPTAGTLLINGRPFRPENGDRLGYLPEERGLYKRESVIDVMTYFGKLKGLSSQQAKTWSKSYLERVGLEARSTVRIDKLSSGQQQKVQLGVTIMGEPELLILDEPTKGFDPVNRRLLMDIIDDQKKSGATILMVTHQMEEAEQLCDRVILLKDGTRRAYGTVTEVLEQFGGATLEVDHVGAIPPSDSYRVIAELDGHATLELGQGIDAADVLDAFIAGGMRVERFAPSRRSLNEIFLEVYGDELDARS
jgi:ABC-2 type transport system ATP-binding protein